MKGIFLSTLAHPRLDCARLHPSRRRVLAAPGDGTDANQLTFPDRLGFARPFAPSSPRPIARLRAGRIGGWTFGTVRQTYRTTRTFPDLTDQARISDVIQDSDFRTEIASRKKTSFSAVPLCVRRTPGDFATSPPFSRPSAKYLTHKDHGIPEKNSSSAIPRGLLTRGEVALCRAPRSLRFQNEVGDVRGRRLRGLAQGQDRPADSFAHRIQARPGPRKFRHPMKAGMIFARKTTWRSRLDLEYLDETSARKASSRQQHNDGPKRPLRQFADYASKETLGQVHAGGFLHHLILINEDGSRTAPSQMTNEERKRRISEAWFEHIRKYPTSSQNPVIQHRLVFSMSREMHDKLVDAGISPDRVLQVHDEEDHGQVQRAVSSGGLDWLRLRDSSRHGQSSHPCRALPAHGAGRVCRVQYGPESRRPATRTR